MIDLEYDEKKDKIDHPANGYKDAADSVCGAYSNLMNRSATWSGGFDLMEDPRMAGRADPDDRFGDDRPD
jgi:hypothetical protein